MKLTISSNNLNVKLTNTKGESIYTCAAESFNVEIDVAKLISSVDEIQQTIFSAVEKAATEPTPLEA